MATNVPGGLQPVFDIALDAVVAMDPDGKISGWNRVAHATFGWSAEEAIGASMGDLIVPPQHREGHRIGLARFNATGDPRILGQRIEITALDKAGNEFPVELSVTVTGEGESRVFIGFLRDIRARREAEAQLARQADIARFLFEMSELAADTESFDDALRACLAAICSITGWPVGHAFLVDAANPAELTTTDLWHEAEAGKAERLRAATKGLRFGLDVGLPGRVLRTGEPAWISDADQDPDFPRKGFGFDSAFAFPVRSAGRIISVLEFFAEDPTAPDVDLMLTVRTLGDQVGRVLERKRTEEHQKLMTRELNHRVRNTLAVVQGLANQTFRGDGVERRARQNFEQRLVALAGAHELLTARDWESASLHDIVAGSLLGCGAAERASVEGPPLWLPPKTVVSLTMAFHELCTNAVKYGALSWPGGSIEITWRLTRDTGPRLHISWREKNGPPVTPPARRGFGTTMIERVLATEVGGAVTLDFAADGLRCEIEAKI